MARVLMLGAFGQRNVGDEALCSALCAALGDHQVVIAGSDPSAIARAHGRAAIASTPRRVAREIEAADLVVVGGGTVFKSLHPTSGRHPLALLANTFGLVRWARHRNTPVAFVGVGADELRGVASRRLARSIVPDASLLVLRDEESAAVLSSAGVTPPFWIGADPAWHLFRDGRRPRRSRGPRPDRLDRSTRPSATVALSHLAGFDADPARLGRALAGLADDGWRIALQPWQDGPGDLDLAERLRRFVPSATVDAAPTDLESAARRFTEDDLVIAMRFHAVVAAGAAGTRTVAVAHEPKLAGLARRLDQIAVPPHASDAVLRAALDWACDHPAPADRAVTSEIDRAAHTIRLMLLLAESGRLDHPDRLPALALSDGGGTW
ncbi:MAG: hypothetical protein CL424_17390 [Acidimicrobiaceae bacterium]|nr:hypothetical protein [Acidimicrobiaceae bacterium]